MWITVLIIIGCILGYLALWGLTGALLYNYLNIESNEAFALAFAVPVFLPIGIAAFFYNKILKWMD